MSVQLASNRYQKPILRCGHLKQCNYLYVYVCKMHMECVSHVISCVFTVCLLVCLLVCLKSLSQKCKVHLYVDNKFMGCKKVIRTQTTIHMHTHASLYMYMYVHVTYVFVCVYMCT